MSRCILVETEVSVLQFIHRHSNISSGKIVANLCDVRPREGSNNRKADGTGIVMIYI